MKRGYKILLIGLAIFVVLGLIVTVTGIRMAKQTAKELEKIDIEQTYLRDVLNVLPDGEYTGECVPNNIIGAKVRVVVENNKITSIDLLEHNNGRGKPAEVLPNKVVEEQSLNIDVISGATASSKVILKAVENALMDGKQKP